MCFYATPALTAPASLGYFAFGIIGPFSALGNRGDRRIHCLPHFLGQLGSLGEEIFLFFFVFDQVKQLLLIAADLLHHDLVIIVDQCHTLPNGHFSTKVASLSSRSTYEINNLQRTTGVAISTLATSTISNR